jgi:hypothetical protein
VPSRALIIVAAMLATSWLAVAGSASSATSAFRTPSGNIHCLWVSDPSYLRCDIVSGLKPVPRRPAGCDLDWGHGIEMTRRGRPVLVCAGDTVISPGSPKLGYGRTWSRGGFVCTSRQSGLTCTNSIGSSFYLSRERYRRSGPPTQTG